MYKVSFEGIGELIASFAAEDAVTPGQVVKVAADGQVGPCSAGDPIFGVACSAEEGFAAVQVKGFTTVSGQGLTAGYVKLSADGAGGVQTDAAGAGYWVASAGTDTVTILL